MDNDDEELAAAGSEDRLSALPEDILIQILLRLGTTGAAQTSILSRRWRLLWRLLPEFDFGPKADGHSIRAALAAHEAPSLRHLLVFSNDIETGPGSIAEWLPVAALRLSGDLFLMTMRPERDSKANEEAEFLELPCFGSATTLNLDLGFLGLAVPPSGVFARLADLSLCNVRFHGPCELGDAISSPRVPSLKKLTIRNAQGLRNFIIHSKSLMQIELKSLGGLQQLNVVAPALEMLNVLYCFAGASASRQPVASISAPKLEILQWCDAFDPSSVQFGKMANLQWLDTYYFLVYGQEDSLHNRNCLMLLQRFQFDAIPTLTLMLAYLPDIIDRKYLMEDMSVLPDSMFLNLAVLANGHCIGPSLFHVLKTCTGVRRLKLELKFSCKLEAKAVCESDCFCDLPPNWTSEQLVLNFLHKVEIANLSGTEHEIAVLKRLLSWAAVLKEMTIDFNYSITESAAKELSKKIMSFSRPEIHIKFYILPQFV